MLLFHLIRSYGVWSSNCLVKFPSHPLPPDPRSSSISHFCPLFPCSLIPAPITLLGKLRYSRDEVGGWREEEILPQCSKRRSLVLSPHPQLCSIRKPTHIPLPSCSPAQFWTQRADIPLYSPGPGPLATIALSKYHVEVQRGMTSAASPCLPPALFWHLGG